MARMSEWQTEAQQAVRKESWGLCGPNQIVKVVPAGRGAAAALDGYFTLAKFLFNKTPEQIEAALGLEVGSLKNGARVYRFTRLPQSSEYEYELTAEYPDGLAYNPAWSDERYPPGSREIHQWRIRKGCAIPVDPRNILDLMPGQPFPPGWV